METSFEKGEGKEEDMDSQGVSKQGSTQSDSKTTITLIYVWCLGF